MVFKSDLKIYNIAYQSLQIPNSKTKLTKHLNDNQYLRLQMPTVILKLFLHYHTSTKTFAGSG